MFLMNMTLLHSPTCTCTYHDIMSYLSIPFLVNCRKIADFFLLFNLISGSISYPELLALRIPTKLTRNSGFPYLALRQ